ncbi:MAG: hypothetical protein AAB069_06775 [Planctomycetota bacterium]
MFTKTGENVCHRQTRVDADLAVPRQRGIGGCGTNGNATRMGTDRRRDTAPVSPRMSTKKTSESLNVQESQNNLVARGFIPRLAYIPRHWPTTRCGATKKPSP